MALTAYRYITIEEGVRVALDRKRRLRLIYKWRHGLDRTHRPANGDRHKMDVIAFHEWLRSRPGKPMPARHS